MDFWNGREGNKNLNIYVVVALNNNQSEGKLNLAARVDSRKLFCMMVFVCAEHVNMSTFRNTPRKRPRS